MEENHIALFPIVRVHELYAVEIRSARSSQVSRLAAGNWWVMSNTDKGEINNNIPEVQFQASASYTPIL